MAGQVTCSGFSSCDHLCQRKDDEEGEVGNGDGGDCGETKQTVATDVTLNTSRNSN